jgi:hypothetical protein
MFLAAAVADVVAVQVQPRFIGEQPQARGVQVIILFVFPSIDFIK